MTAAQRQPTLPLARRETLAKIVASGRHDAFLRRWQRDVTLCRTPSRLEYDARHGDARAAGFLHTLNCQWAAVAPRELRCYSWRQVYDALRRSGKLIRRVAEHTRVTNPGNPAASPLPESAQPEPSPIASAPAPPVHNAPHLYPAPEPSEREHLLAVIERMLPRATTGRLARAVAALADE